MESKLEKGEVFSEIGMEKDSVTIHTHASF